LSAASNVNYNKKNFNQITILLKQSVSNNYIYTLKQPITITVTITVKESQLNYK